MVRPRSKTIVVFSRNSNFFNNYHCNAFQEERVRCPHGVEFSFNELRDRSSGKPIAWVDGQHHWHSIGSGQIYSSIDVVPC